jgi:hypothetical protein
MEEQEGYGEQYVRCRGKGVKHDSQRRKAKDQGARPIHRSWDSSIEALLSLFSRRAPWRGSRKGELTGRWIYRIFSIYANAKKARSNPDFRHEERSPAAERAFGRERAKVAPERAA